MGIGIISFIDSGDDNGWSDLEMSRVLIYSGTFQNGKRFHVTSAIKYLLDENKYDLADKLFNLTQKNTFVDLYFTATTGKDIENNPKYIKCCLFLGSDSLVPSRDSNNRTISAKKINEFSKRILNSVAMGYVDSIDRCIAQKNEEEATFYRNKVALFKENFDEERSDFYKNIIKDHHVGTVDEDLRGENRIFQKRITEIKGECRNIRILEAKNLEDSKRRNEIK
ncbi:MAG: hypothetical protein ACJA02_000365 [Myxococcota bacterium]|jgi:hypothetical protein